MLRRVNRADRGGGAEKARMGGLQNVCFCYASPVFHGRG